MSHYDWNFEIRKTVPGYKPGNANHEKLYNHMNAMCYLLDGVPYRVVYGPARTFAQILLDKLDPNHIKEDVLKALFGEKLLESLRENLKDIVKVEGSDEVELRYLYEHVVGVGTKEQHVLIEFQRLEQDDDEHRLCMPFLDIQETGNVVDETDMDAHIAMIGEFTLKQIYTCSKMHYPDLYKAVKHGRKKDILGRPGNMADMGVLIFNPINDKKCDPNGPGCITSPGSWCNVDSNGNCTTGSL